MSLTRRDPFHDLARTFLGGPNPWPYEGSRTNAPNPSPGWVETLPLDVFDQGGDLVVKAALPGVKPDEVEITVDADVLTIRAQHKDEKDIKEGDYYIKEYRAGTLSRSVRLPDNIMADHCKTQFEHGVLKLTFPRQPESKPKVIRITPAG